MKFHSEMGHENDHFVAVRRSGVAKVSAVLRKSIETP